MKRQMTKIEKAGIIALVLVAGFYFYIKKVYDPEVVRFGKARKEVAGLEKKLNKLGDAPNPAQMEASVARQRRELTEIEKRVAGMYRKVRNGAAAQQAIAVITAIADGNGLSVEKQVFKENLAPAAQRAGKKPARSRKSRRSRRRAAHEVEAAREPSELDGFSWFKYRLTLRGGYAGFLEFVKGIRKAERLLIVNDLHITASGEPGKVEISMEILF